MSIAAAEPGEFSEKTRRIGDSIAELNLKEAKELSTYLEAAYGIKPSVGAPIISHQVETTTPAKQTEFDVVLTSFGDKKLDVVKIIKNITGASLMDAKKMVESAPTVLKQGISEEEAQKLKSDIEAIGGTVELK